MMHRNWLDGDLTICVLANKLSYRNHLYYIIPLCKPFFLMNFKEDGLESKFRTDTVVLDRDSGRVMNTEEYEQLEQNARCAERTGSQPS